MTALLRRVASLLIALGMSLGAAHSAALSGGEYVFLKHHGVSKYGEGTFTAEQQLLPAEVEATEEGRVKVHGVWIDRSDVMNVDETIKHYTIQLESEPSHATSLLRRGMAFQLAEQYSSAIQDYNAVICNEALRWGSINSTLFLNRGIAWRKLGNWDKALSDVEECIRLNPKEWSAFHELGILRLKREEYDEAITAETQAIVLRPGYLPAYHNRALAWIRKSEYERAVPDLNEIVRRDPNNVAALLLRGSVYYSKGTLRKSLDDYDEVLRVDPQNHEALEMRARVYQLQGNWHLAINDFREVIRLAPSPNSRANISAYLGLAAIFATASDEKVRDGRDAINLATKACIITGWKDSHCLGILAVAHAEAGEFEMAVMRMQQAIDLSPEQDKPRSAKLMSEFRAGRPIRVGAVVP